MAICGNLRHSMSAKRLPPNAGRVIISLLPSALRPVQSAVRPVPSSDAILGASSLPREVAPMSTVAGSMRLISDTMQDAYASGM